MSKVLHLGGVAQSPIGFLKQSLDVITNLPPEEEIVSIVIAFKAKDGSVLTGYFNAPNPIRQELVGHIQCDIIDQMILINIERYK